MTKVYSRNKRFTGVRGKVVFNEGVADVEDKNALKWFQGREGYSVGKPFPESTGIDVHAGDEIGAGPELDYNSMSKAELVEQAKSRNVDGATGMTKAELVATLSELDQ